MGHFRVAMLAFAADFAAMFAANVTWSGQAKILAQAAPADDRNLFLLAHQPADPLARTTAAAVGAGAVLTLASARPAI